MDLTNGAGQNNSRTSADGTTQTSSTQLKDYQIIARIAARFLLVATLIVNTRTEDAFLIGASLTSLYGGILLAKAAIVESSEQQIAPGVTTFANTLKMIGTIVNVGMAFLLFIALITEVALKQRPTVAGQTPAAGAAGALFI